MTSVVDLNSGWLTDYSILIDHSLHAAGVYSTLHLPHSIPEVLPELMSLKTQTVGVYSGAQLTSPGARGPAVLLLRTCSLQHEGILLWPCSGIKRRMCMCETGLFATSRIMRIPISKLLP